MDGNFAKTGGVASPNLFLSILLLAAALGAMASSIYIPSISAIARDLSANISLVQLTITVYLITFGVSAVMIGSLSDYLGRRRVLLSSMCLCLVASTACMLAPNIEVLFAARIFQAIGACAGMAVTRATLRDTYGSEGTPRVMSILSLSMVLVPIFAPILGGYLQVWVGWRANFAVLAIGAAALVVLMWWRLPETGSNRPPSRNLARAIFGNILPLCRAGAFMGYAFVVVASGSAYFAFTAVTPVILIEHFGLTPDQFGLCGSLIMGGTLVGIVLTNRLVTRLGIDRLIPVGTLIMAVSGVLTMALSSIHAVWAVVGPLSLMGIGIGLLAPNGHSGAVGAKPELAGAASGLTVFLQMGGAGIVTAVMSAVEHRTTLPFGILLVVLAAISFIGHRVARSGSS